MTIKEIKTTDLIPYENNLQGCRIAIINDKYLITSKGDIYRLIKHGKRVFELQAKRKHNNEYLRGVIDGKDVYIHRLVAEAFIPNPHNYKEINHIDGNKENNNAENLEWCSRKQNCIHAYKTGLRKPIGRKLTEQQIKDIRNSNLSYEILANNYGVSIAAIYQIKHFKTYKEVV